MVKEIYCPSCMKNGRKKRILRADSGARGIVYAFCKQCRKEIKIDLKEEPLSRE